MQKNLAFHDLLLTKDGGFIIPNSDKELKLFGLIKTDIELDFPKEINNDNSTIGTTSDYDDEKQSNEIVLVDDNVTSECDNNSGKSSFQICPEKGAGTWEIVQNKSNAGYALVRVKIEDHGFKF